MTDFPRSGVHGLLPLQVRERMVSLGWAAIPIMAAEGTKKGAGKRPLFKDWDAFAAYGASLPTRDDLRTWNAKAFAAPGTGIAGGRVLVIDLDFSDPSLIDMFRGFALECLGETPFVRVGRAPRCALVYVAAEPIPSHAYKVEGENGEGLDIIGEGKQLVAFGIHPVTRRPYVWEGETPITAGPDAADEVTAEQVDAFVERVRTIVPLTATGGRRAREGGGSAEIVRDADGFVTDGREGFLRNQVYRAAVHLHEEGEPLTVAAVAERGWALFCAETRPDPARWTFREALEKAEYIIRRIRTRQLTLPQLSVAAPTYPDNRAPLAAAERATAEKIENFFGRVVPAYMQAVADHALSVESLLARAREARRIVLLPVAPMPPAHALRIAVGLGKTEQALQRIAQAVRMIADAAARGPRIVYAVPTHGLAEEVAQRFAALGVSAEIVRGYDRSDPLRDDGAKMCLDAAAAAAASKARLPIPSTLCVSCPFAGQCGKDRERRATPQVWIVTHASLFGRRPEHVFAPDALVIDEGFALNAVPSERPTGDDSRVEVERLTLDGIAAEDATLYGEDGEIDREASADLAEARALAVAALRRHGEGQVSCAGLGLSKGDADVLRRAAGLETRRLLWDIPTTGDLQARDAALAAAGAVNGRVYALAGLLSDLADIADGEAEPSDRLRVALDKAKVFTVTRAPLRPVHPTWRVPTLMLDATAPSPGILAPVLGLPVEMRADIAAVYSPHITVNHFVGAPVSQRGLGFQPGEEEADDTAPDPRIIGDLVNHITLRAAEAYPRFVAVVGSKKLEAKLSTLGLPPNVETGHFGALAGLDKWKTFAGIIVIGWSLPRVQDAERIASILTGRAVQTIDPDAHDRIMFPFVPGAIRRQGKAPFPTKRPQHPDPIVEEVRRQVCEATVEQAVGRIRPLRREPWVPAFVDIIGDTPLNLTVDAVMRWENVRLGTWAALVRSGMGLGSRNDLVGAFPELGLTTREARGMVEAFGDSTPIMNLYKGVLSPNRRATYKVRGKGKRTVEALLFPTGPQTPDELRLELARRGILAESVTVESLKTRDRRPGALKATSLIGRQATESAARFAEIGACADAEAERRRVIRKRFDFKNVNLIFRLKAA